ncbi:PIN domain-containing protein [Cognataquiflexum aquatile]|jgi:predicted nucleic acid-binding protein|uniref:PIN domain-containing protein n=1 Tax=Cognataquiflexum aquatile TaxID=2249427 RepID=UPI000DEA1615|nr:PIN domain-containing protein [Cognataquiflexum aquatile]
MRIVVDTNVVFSAMLNSNSKIAKIFLHPKSKFNFYATERLLDEIEEHSEKLMKLSGYSEAEFKRILAIFTRKIRFINLRLIPKNVFEKTLVLTEDVDIDDTEFVALTEHIKGKFWSGDKALQKGLKNKGWNRFITTDQLFGIIDLK